MLIEDGHADLIRRRQTFEDLIHGESIPKRAGVDLRATSMRRLPRKKAPAEVAVIYADHCTGCEACIEVCPVDCIEKIPQYAGRARPPGLLRNRLGSLYWLPALHPPAPVSEVGPLPLDRLSLGRHRDAAVGRPWSPWSIGWEVRPTMPVRTNRGWGGRPAAGRTGRRGLAETAAGMIF